MRTKLLIIICTAVLFTSCCRNSEKNAENAGKSEAVALQSGYEMLTQLISYSVPVRNGFDTLGYAENIANPTKQKFTDQLLDAVLDGKIKAFTPQHEPLKIEDLKNALRVEKEIVSQNENGAEVKKKMVFDMRKMVDKIGFLEEWSLNPSTMHINKKVIGICPMCPVFLSDGTIAGYLELFWIYFDAKYPEALKNKVS